MDLGQIPGDPLKAFCPLTSANQLVLGVLVLSSASPGRICCPIPFSCLSFWSLCLRPLRLGWEGSSGEAAHRVGPRPSLAPHPTPQPPGGRDVASGSREGTPAGGPAFQEEPPCHVWLAPRAIKWGVCLWSLFFISVIMFYGLWSPASTGHPPSLNTGTSAAGAVGRPELQ